MLVYKHKLCPSMVKLCKMYVVNRMMDQVVNIEQAVATTNNTIVTANDSNDIDVGEICWLFTQFPFFSFSLLRPLALFLCIVLSWNCANETIEIYCAIKSIFLSRIL